MIEVIVNGQPTPLEPGATVEALVEVIGCGRRGVAVAVDAEVVPRSAWAAHTLCGGERVEVLGAAQGG
jgi:sulfur carrier protein